MSSSVKLVIGVILAVLGILGIVVAIIYVAIPIHSLPSFIPGKHAVNGHYHKRAALSGVIGIVLLALAAVVAFRTRRGPSVQAGTPVS